MSFRFVFCSLSRIFEISPIARITPAPPPALLSLPALHVLSNPSTTTMQYRPTVSRVRPGDPRRSTSASVAPSSRRRARPGDRATAAPVPPLSAGRAQRPTSRRHPCARPSWWQLRPDSTIITTTITSSTSTSSSNSSSRGASRN